MATYQFDDHNTVLTQQNTGIKESDFESKRIDGPRCHSWREELNGQRLIDLNIRFVPYFATEWMSYAI